MTTLLSPKDDNAPPQSADKNTAQPAPPSQPPAHEQSPPEADQLTPKQQIQKIIADCSSFIKHAQAEISKATSDKEITGWLEVNFQHNAATLTACNVPATLQGPRDRFKRELPRLSSSLQHLENDIGNLDADFKLHQKIPKTTLPRARQLEEEHLALKKLLETIREDCKLLKETHAILRKSLTPATLLPLAKDISADKGPIFDIGYKLYRLTSDHKQEGDEEKNLDDFFSEATKQETLLSKITFPELPKLAATVITQQVKTTIKITAALKDGIDLLRDTFAPEQKHTKDTEARITRLGKEDLSELLKRINEEAEALYKGMLRFHYKAHNLDKVYDIEEILLLLQLLQRAIKNDLQTKLKEEISTPGSPIHLATAASAAADQFLKGSKGFWRGLRLLLRLLMGKQTVNLAVFETTLIDALNCCDTFYGNTPEDILPLENFINEKLSEYDAPFPRDDLYNIMKRCLHDYGSCIESFCLSYKVDTSSFAGEKGAVSVKKLISQISSMSAKLIQ
ncbi:MAG: hypothetical protein OEL66_02880 [Desulfobulbaceae bacterium]|nr:hypothetical protein [Desulfobulbaceae bacterium]